MLASARNGTLYVGVTNDLSRRMTEHKSGLVPGFTRQYGVKRLVYFEEHASILEAREREHRMKRWQRAWKLELIELNPDWRDLAAEIPNLGKAMDASRHFFWAPDRRFGLLRSPPLVRGTRP
jgi:putative endonuclease